MIHTEDSAVDDQNTITSKENKIISLLQRIHMSQHILLDLSGLPWVYLGNNLHSKLKATEKVHTFLVHHEMQLPFFFFKMMKYPELFKCVLIFSLFRKLVFLTA